MITYFDPLYFWVFIISMLIALGAQLYMSSAYKKWGKTKNSSGVTGTMAGQLLVVKNNLNNVKFDVVKGELTDFYNPSDHTVHMSQSTSNKDTVSAMAIVAHELGHAQQHQVGSVFIKARNFLVPALKFSPQLSYAFIMMGLIFNLTGLFQLGIIFYAIVVLFSIVTLPVELDASRRGLAMLEQAGLFKTQEDREGSKKVLTAAASTYIAAAITSLLQLLYYVSIARRNS